MDCDGESCAILECHLSLTLFSVPKAVTYNLERVFNNADVQIEITAEGQLVLSADFQT